MGWLLKIAWIIVGLILLLMAGVTALGWALSSPVSPAHQQHFATLPYFADGQFFNQERQASFEITWDGIMRNFVYTEQRVPPAPLPVDKIPAAHFDVDPSAELVAWWLGHASVMVEFDGYRILIDPILSERASPFQFVGPSRFHPPPIALQALRNVDAVVISHNHYDHLDEATIRHLAAQGARIFVPLGAGEQLLSWGLPMSQVHESEWWQEQPLGRLRIVATPTRHYSGRGLFDYKATHWASWSLIGPEHRVFYSGDTGYSSQFEQIGERYAPFDLALIKTGSYGPGQAWLDVHMTPEDALRVYRDVGGQTLLPVHWATFNLAEHDWDEPIRRVVAAAERADARIVTPRLGERVVIDKPYTNQAWWEAVR